MPSRTTVLAGCLTLWCCGFAAAEDALPKITAPKGLEAFLNKAKVDGSLERAIELLSRLEFDPNHTPNICQDESWQSMYRGMRLVHTVYNSFVSDLETGLPRLNSPMQFGSAFTQGGRSALLAHWGVADLLQLRTGLNRFATLSDGHRNDLRQFLLKLSQFEQVHRDIESKARDKLRDLFERDTVEYFWRHSALRNSVPTAKEQSAGHLEPLLGEGSGIEL